MASIPKHRKRQRRQEATMLPEPVRRGIEAALGCPVHRAEPAVGGTHGRTFRLTADGQTWIARCEPADGLQLRRAARAQAIARTVGVRVPAVVASDFAPEDPGTYVWMLEECLPGEHWSDEVTGDAARALSFQLGEQLRALHAVPVDAYGLLPPSPYPMIPTFADYMAHEEAGVEDALRLAGLGNGLLPGIRAVIDRLRALPSEGPRFGHVDTCGSNLLVEGDRLVAIVDWEWAGGRDAAGNVAEWWFWHQQSGDLNAFLRGYRPESLDLFRWRIEAHLVLAALMLIRIYHYQQDPTGIQSAAAALRTLLTAGLPA